MCARVCRYVLAAAGVYCAMLISSFLFGESVLPPVGPVRWTRARVARRRQRAAAAAAITTITRKGAHKKPAHEAKGAKGGVKKKPAHRTVMLYRPVRTQHARRRRTLQVKTQ